MDVKGFLSVDILRVIRKLSIKTSRYVWSNVIIAYELSHMCGVLSQSVRKSEPPSAELEPVR